MNSLKTRIFAVTFILFSGGTCSYAANQDFEQIKQIEMEAYSKRSPEEIIERPKIEYTAQDKRDPFQVQVFLDDESEKPVSINDPIVTPPMLTVQGLIWGTGLPQAIINNKVLKVGDIIEGCKIVSIEKEGISIFYQGRPFNIGAPASAGSLSKTPQGGKNEKKF
jgi:hypothetical protein